MREQTYRASEHVLQRRNLNFKCGVVIDERYSWMQGLPLKLPYNCHESMQIDPSPSCSSYAFWENVSAIITECSWTYFPCTSRLEIGSYYGKWATFWPREEEQVAATLRRKAVKMTLGCDSHFKPFWMFCFWGVNAPPSQIISVCGSQAHNWFWRSYLGKRRDDE